MTSTKTTVVRTDEVSQEEYFTIQKFIYREARLADESQYAEWESLWDAEGFYWIPVGDGNYDPDVEVSIVYDNRARIASRVRQLMSGKRFAQVPASVMRRTISNLEVARGGESEYQVEANFMLMEMPMQSSKEIRLWGGRVQYLLRASAEGFKIGRKKVILVNGAGPIPNLPFLI
ncbi:MAG: aromatic-ring-hydroxylating dioxygenase subunit beta [Burkholderiaceae bacterium]|nr:aromatic-ring-hydroxylating dioxygenase subunit beta [Burkholderiaceae bacterium]